MGLIGAYNPGSSYKDEQPGRCPMRPELRLLTPVAVLAIVLVQSAPSSRAAAQVQSDTKLTGQVTSSEEGTMEGVLVSARKVGSTLTTTVVSDGQGRYRFPATRLE